MSQSSHGGGVPGRHQRPQPADGERCEAPCRSDVGPAGAGHGRPQRRRPPDAEQQLVAAGVVDDEDPVAGEARAQLADQRRGEERQVAGEQRDDVRGHRRRGRPAARRPARRPAAARGRRTTSGGHRLRRADDDPSRGVGDRVEDGGEHRAATHLELRLRPARPAGPPCRRPARRPCRAAAGPRRHRRPRTWVPSSLVGRVTSRTPVLRIRGPVHTTRPDTVAAEEPLEIRLAGTPLAVTMRTPGDDFDLVHGFLATEGVIAGHDDIAGLRYCDSVDADGRNTYNVVDVDLAPGVPIPDTGLERNFYTSSSCGVCGKASIDAIRTKTRLRRRRRRAAAAAGGAARAARPAARRAGGVRARPAGCTRPGLFTAGGRAGRAARGRRAAQRRRQGHRGRRPRRAGCRWPGTCSW